MFNRIRDGLEEGRRRYGAKNANQTCARCGSGLGPGSICDCDKYKKTSAANAAGRLIVAGGDSDDVAFVHCQTCDEGIDEKRIQDHLKDGHTVEKVMKVLKNDAPPLPGTGTTLGYDYGTSTTTATPGQSCQECGHALSQKFYDTNCSCRCHAELDNTVCDICRHEEGAGLEEHLVSRHGMQAEVAIVVAADMEERRNDSGHEHDFKKVVETDGAHWFVCKGCGERMTVPKE